MVTLSGGLALSAVAAKVGSPLVAPGGRRGTGRRFRHRGGVRPARVAAPGPAGRARRADSGFFYALAYIGFLVPTLLAVLAGIASYPVLLACLGGGLPSTGHRGDHAALPGAPAGRTRTPPSSSGRSSDRGGGDGPELCAGQPGVHRLRLGGDHRLVLPRRGVVKAAGTPRSGSGRRPGDSAAMLPEPGRSRFTFSAGSAGLVRAFPIQAMATSAVAPRGLRTSSSARWQPDASGAQPGRARVWP